MTRERALELVLRELDRAEDKFGSFNSKHEGLAVIEEEFLELRDEVFWGDPTKAKDEAEQVAAMALRFLIDLYEE